VGEQFLGKPYEAGMLDRTDTEQLVISLVSFDCVLYVESVLALSLTIALGQSHFSDFAAHLRALRYRNGQVNGYCTRLHYFTDWIESNQKMGKLRDITTDVGGIEETKQLDFMTQHRSAYPRMASRDTYVCIQEMENRFVRSRQAFIPQEAIAAAYPHFRAGDIIATSTSIEGLDVTHTGFVYQQPDGGTGFLHASSSGEVKIADDLEEYVQGNKVQRGIVVIRPIDPRTQTQH
jgi:hypothetical protein